MTQQKHDLAVAFLKSNSASYIESILQDRIKAHHMQLLTYVLTILATNGWKETSFGHDACMHPLQNLLCLSTMLPLNVVLLEMSGRLC